MIGIVGASGMIGSSIKEYFESIGEQVIGTYNKNKVDGLYRYDIGGEYDGIFDACDTVIVSGSINNIDECASNSEMSNFINIEKTIELIDSLCNNGKMVVFLSSDQVFDGKSGGYSEGDTVNPVNTYGKQKLIVERHIQKYHQKKYIIVRLSKTYSEDLSKTSMYSQIINKLKKNEMIKCATDQIFSPTNTVFVAEKLYKLLKLDFTGVVHIAQQNVMSRYDFALNVAKKNNLDESLIVPVLFEYFGSLEKRGLNSWLRADKIANLTKEKI